MNPLYSFITVALLAFLHSSDCLIESVSSRKSYLGLRQTSKVVLSDTNLFKKVGGVLILNLSQEKKVVLRDFIKADDETEVKRYNYLGFSNAINRFVIEVTYYEKSDFLLVSKDGEMDIIWDVPYASSDGKTLIALSKGMENAVYPNGFQLFKINSNGLFKVCEKLVTSYEPSDLRWIDNRVFVLELSDIFNVSNKKKYTNFRII
jgi:hypothetical protein